MIFLHCYHYFRLGGLRKSTEINCKMDVLEMLGLLDCTAEKFLMYFILPWCNVSILTYIRADKQKALPESCRLPAYSEAITVWRHKITLICLCSCVPMNTDRRAQSSYCTVSCTTHTHIHTKMT